MPARGTILSGASLVTTRARSSNWRVNIKRVSLFLLLATAGLIGQAQTLPSLSVTDQTLLLRSVVTNTGTQMTDTTGDFVSSGKNGFVATDYTAYDIVGDANTAAVSYAYGTYSAANSLLFQVRLNAFKTLSVDTNTTANFYTPRLVFGLDSNADGNLDVFFNVGGTAAAPLINFYTAASGSQNSPNNTGWSATAITGASVSATLNQNYSYAESTATFGTENDALFRIIVTLPQLNTALTGAGATNLAAGSSFRVVAMTTTSTTGFADLDMTGYGTASSSAYNNTYGNSTVAVVPEPSFYGALLLSLGGAGLWLYGRRQ